jgi:hypothetical protein
VSELPPNLRSVDWSVTTYEGARREQLRRWAELPLDQVIASLEEMEALSEQWRASDGARGGSAPIRVHEDGLRGDRAYGLAGRAGCQQRRGRRLGAGRP